MNRRLRKQYTNTRYPMIVLRFEDGHEIRVPRGVGKSFEAFAGETIKIVAIWDPTSEERELVDARRADAFDDAKPQEPA